MKLSIVDEYRKCAETCRTTDYGNSLSVRAHNRSAKKMCKLVKDSVKVGNEGIESLAKLLDEPVASEWLSYQLLETADDLRPEIEIKCLEIIQNIANDDTRHANSFGARAWLAKWTQKKNKKV